MPLCQVWAAVLKACLGNCPVQGQEFKDKKEKLSKNTIPKGVGKVQKYRKKLAMGSRKENLVS